MRINSVTLTIDNFDNAAMVDDPAGEVARILTELAERLDGGASVYDVFDGPSVRDTNGNRVGKCECDYDDDDDDDSEMVDECPIG